MRFNSARNDLGLQKREGKEDNLCLVFWEVRPSSPSMKHARGREGNSSIFIKERQTTNLLTLDATKRGIIPC